MITVYARSTSNSSSHSWKSFQRSHSATLKTMAFPNLMSIRHSLSHSSPGTLDSSSISLSAGLVPEPTGQVPEAGEAAPKSAGALRHPLVQRHDAQHPELQCITRLSAVPASQFNQSISPGERQLADYLPSTGHNALFSALSLLQDLFQMGASSYPGMTQPFSMSHSSNMGSVRQDSMGKCLGEGSQDDVYVRRR